MTRTRDILRILVGPRTLAYFVAVTLSVVVLEFCSSYLWVGGSEWGLPFAWTRTQEFASHDQRGQVRYLPDRLAADLAIYYAGALLLVLPRVRRERGPSPSRAA